MFDIVFPDVNAQEVNSRWKIALKGKEKKAKDRKLKKDHDEEEEDDDDDDD